VSGFGRLRANRILSEPSQPACFLFLVVGLRAGLEGCGRLPGLNLFLSGRFGLFPERKDLLLTASFRLAEFPHLAVKMTSLSSSRHVERSPMVRFSSSMSLPRWAEKSLASASIRAFRASSSARARRFVEKRLPRQRESRLVLTHHLQFFSEDGDGTGSLLLLRLVGAPFFLELMDLFTSSSAARAVEAMSSSSRAILPFRRARLRGARARFPAGEAVSRSRISCPRAKAPSPAAELIRPRRGERPWGVTKFRRGAEARAR